MSNHPIKDVREAKNVSQKRLAHLLGLSVSMYNQMELNNLFNLRQLLLLANEMRVDVNDLVVENEIISLLNKKEEPNQVKLSDSAIEDFAFFFTEPDEDEDEDKENDEE